MCDSFVCTDSNGNISLNADKIGVYGVYWFIGAYLVFRSVEHFLGALYFQANRELLSIPPGQRWGTCCTKVYRQMWLQFGRSFFSVLSFLLVLEKNYIMFILLIVLDVVFVFLRFKLQKKDKAYTSVKQELYYLFMNIDHDTTDEVYNKMVEYIDRMKKADNANNTQPVRRSVPKFQPYRNILF